MDSKAQGAFLEIDTNDSGVTASGSNDRMSGDNSGA
jgi:hypothetical protein